MIIEKGGVKLIGVLIRKRKRTLGVDVANGPFDIYIQYAMDVIRRVSERLYFKSYL